MSVKEAVQPQAVTEKLSVVYAALALSMVVCLNFPAVIYHANTDDIDIAIGYIGLVLVPLSLILTGILSLPGFFFKGKAKDIYASFLGALAVASWVLGTFLIGERGLLNGDTLLRSDSMFYQVTELVALLAGLLLIAWLSLKVAKLLKSILLVLMLLSAGTLGFAVFTDEKSYALPSSEDSLYRVSSSKNVFVFLFDGFLSDMFQDILKKQPELAQDFDGFTYFPKATGVAPTTYLSIPAIHSAMPYPENLSLKEYYRRAVKNGSFISMLAENGYDASGINFVKGPPDLATNFRGKEISEGFWRASIKEAFYLFDISLYRSVPSILKASIYDQGEWLTSKSFADSLAIRNNKLLDSVGEKFRPSYTKPAVRWIHLYNTHAPASVDSNCRLVRHTKWNMENAQNQAYCAVRHFVHVLQEFKKNRIYDNSVIFLIADHGIDFSLGLRPALLSSSHPIFLVKPIGSRGKLQISDTSVFLTDVPKTVCALTRDCSFAKGLSAFDATNKLRNRRKITFYEYKWQNGYWGRRHLPIRARYFILGPADDVLSWYKDVSPDNVTTLHLSFNDSDDADAFGLGWAEATKDGSRSVLGRYAQLYLPLIPQKDAILEIHLQTDTHNRNQYLKVFANNQEAGGAPVRAGKEEILKIKIPAEKVTKPVTRITFEFSEAYDPDPQPERMKDTLTAVAALFNDLNVRY